MSKYNCLVVKVERGTCNPHSPFVKLFEKSLQVDFSISVPYEMISYSLCFLYGDDVIVSFSSQLLTLKNK